MNEQQLIDMNRLVKVFNLTNPKLVRIRKDVKTKLGLAFAKGEMIQVYENGVINSGPYTGKMGYAAFSARNNVLTSIRPSSFVVV